MAKKSELVAAYRATTYRVSLPDAVCDLRVDQLSPLMRDSLQQMEFNTFSVLTAYNPASQLLSPEDNEKRQNALRSELERGGVTFLAGDNRPDTEVWPVEPSVCIFDLSLQDVCQLGLKYGQNALVFGERDGVPHLHWLTDTEFSC